MMGFVRIAVVLLKAVLYSRSRLVAENLALRQQLLVLQRTGKRPRLRKSDRIFWVWLSRLWRGWRSALLIVQPETVIRWHRQGFRLYWRWKSRSGPGRPKIDGEIRQLIRRMSGENPTWGAPRILSELYLLGHSVAESTVAKYMVRPRKPPSPTWRSFLQTHVGHIAAVDFFTVATITFRVLYCFIVLRHGRRQLLHVNVTANPTAQWAARQVHQAFPYDHAPKYMIRDRDSIYGEVFRQSVEQMGIEEVLIAPRSLWENPYAERVIGSIRRECLDHLIVLDEDHLRRILAEYVEYYNNVRPHLSLQRNAPSPRSIEPPEKGEVVAIPCLGGLHHRYTRAA